MKQTNRTRLQSRLNSLLSLVLLLVFFGLVAWASTQYTFEQDWTRTGRHTLSEASQQVIEQLKEPITITAYARDEKPLRDGIRQFVKRYQRAKPDITLEFVNPELVPDEVRQRGITVNGELVIQIGERTEHVKNINEQSLTNAMRRLARGSQRKLVFLEGHGERAPRGQANYDLKRWTDELASSGYQIETVNLGAQQTLPEDISVLVLAGPQAEVFPGEIDIIRDHINNGGNLLWLSDPGKQYGLQKLTDDLGIQLQTGTIIDFAGQMIGIDDPTIALTTPGLYGDHAITQDFEYMTIYPLAGGVTANKDSTWQATPFITSGDHTWLETGSLKGEVNFNRDTETAGPINVGLALKRDHDNGQQRVAIVRDGDFLSNTYVSNAGNIELGNRIANWLSADDEMITIPTQTRPDARLQLGNTQAIIIGFGFLVVLPIALFATGFIIWWRRRKR